MPITMGGFSGINTDQMIQQLMYIERQPIRRMEDKQDELNKQIDAWQAINTSLDTLKNKALDLEGVFDEMTTSSSDEDVLTATATADASLGSYDIDVSNLAQVHRVASDQQTDSTSDLNLGADDTGGTFNIELASGDNFDVTVTGDDSLNDVKDAINNAGNNDDGDGNKLVKASVVDNTLVIESTETGTSNELSFTDGNDVLEELGVLATDGTIKNQLQGAQDAQFSVNDLSITRESNTIDDVIDGVTLELEGSGTSTLTIDADKEQMEEKIKAFVDQYNAFQDKLAKYGGKEAVLQGDATLGSIESMLSNSVVYPSTTVSSTEWLSSNALSTSGDLEITANGATNTVSLDGSESLSEIADKIDGTSGVTSYVESNRIVIESNDSSPVDLSGSSSTILDDLKLPETFSKNTASLLGVEVDRNGKLSIDSEDLDDALENNLSDLNQMFTGVNGIMDRVEEQVDLATDTFEGYVENRIDSLNDEVDYLDDDIANMERRLELREENLRQKFTNMEEMVSQMQSQGNWLSSQISSMGLG